jgi:hypothetical protein
MRTEKFICSSSLALVGAVLFSKGAKPYCKQQSMHTTVLLPTPQPGIPGRQVVWENSFQQLIILLFPTVNGLYLYLLLNLLLAYWFA